MLRTTIVLVFLVSAFSSESLFAQDPKAALDAWFACMAEERDSLIERTTDKLSVKEKCSTLRDAFAKSLPEDLRRVTMPEIDAAVEAGLSKPERG